MTPGPSAPEQPAPDQSDPDQSDPDQPDPDQPDPDQPDPDQTHGHQSHAHQEHPDQPSDGTGPYPSFVDAARDVVAFLHGEVGLDLWLVTRIVDGQQLAVAASPARLVRPGSGIPWAEGFCSRMADGRGPRVAAVTAEVPAYAGLGFGPARHVDAYLGVPLRRVDGALYGTLCGFGTKAVAKATERRALEGCLGLVELCARLLGTVLEQEGAAVVSQRLIERVVADSERDVLTGLLNRRGWERALAGEEARCARSGAAATVLVLDLDGLKQVNDTAGHAAGDDLLRRAAEVLQDNSRPSDVLARLGGDEFAVLMTDTAAEPEESEEPGRSSYAARLAGCLAAAEIPASLGVATRRTDEAGGLTAVWDRADGNMYAAKSGRRLPR